MWARYKLLNKRCTKYFTRKCARGIIYKCFTENSQWRNKLWDNVNALLRTCISILGFDWCDVLLHCWKLIVCILLDRLMTVRACNDSWGEPRGTIPLWAVAETQIDYCKNVPRSTSADTPYRCHRKSGGKFSTDSPRTVSTTKKAKLETVIVERTELSGGCWMRRRSSSNAVLDFRVEMFCFFAWFRKWNTCHMKWSRVSFR